MRKKFEWQWEILDKYTKRAKVIGGWLINYGSHTNKGAISEALVFIADPDHLWTIMPISQSEIKKECPTFPEI